MVKAALWYLLSQTSIKWVGISQPHILSLTAAKQINAALPERKHITSEYLLQDKSTVRRKEPGIHPFIFFFFFQVKNSVVMLPDCNSEYNNASVLPGERNITLFTALLFPKKRLEKQPMSLTDGIWGRSDCNARSNYQSRATCRGFVTL